jgi:hypothetical protein
MNKRLGRPLGSIFLRPSQTQVQRKFLGGLMETIGKGLSRAKEAIGALFSNKLPKSFRDTLEKHKDKKIKTIEICRVPLTKATNTFANLISGGRFEEVAKKQGEAGFFHLFSIITLDDGTRLIYEKNERPVLQVNNSELSDKAQTIMTSGRNIPLGEFIKNAMKSMGDDKYITYDPLTNNCQDFLLASLSSNGLISGGLSKFIKQDLEELIEKTPEFSKILSKGATGIGGTLRQIWEELTAKKGRIIRRLSP